ncbi:DUF3231 family protein [Tuberibacillus sp. Marseille-P3662]|uniref:DUF3231 family protein n=1 Tax=Tuberibacillus sp. Marseille-P3662 TaxID=1965358 RepID=UPI0020CB43FB|nr:DUF3231 family protein [Tuberibacillus sp. Marseille-P3662]
MTKEQEPLTSSELATLWVVYEKKTMMVRIIDFFLVHNQDPEARKIFQSFIKGESKFVKELSQIFKQEGAAVPVGFTENDVNHSAPKLYDDIFEVMYLRTMMKIASGIHALHISMSYRKDIMNLYQKFTKYAEAFCEETTQYLLDKGVLPKSPYINLPKHVEFAKTKDYRSGLKLTGHRRPLNAVEVAYLYQTVEANIAGMKLMTGFAQVAKAKDIRQYFFRGKELSKQITKTFSNILMESDINAPATSAGRVTNSTMSPFSDKLMMYNTSLLNSFALGSNAIGTTFSLRKDLPLKMMGTAKDILDFASDGGDLMIEHGLMEEPPQMEDRTQLSKGQNG